MIPSDPLYAQQWHFDRLGNIEKIWDEYSGAGIHVGVYDTGVELDHPDLVGNYDASLEVDVGSGPISGDVNIAGADPGTSPAHGTAVAGIITAGANNGEGGVGVAWGASLTSVNIFDTTSPLWINAVDYSDFLSALHQMTNFDVINNSWSSISDLYYDPTSNDLSIYSKATLINNEYAHASEFGRAGLGTVIVQGVGNDNIDAQGYGLNASRFTITIAGTMEDGFAAAFSNYGACLLVTAPATNIVTTDLTGSDGLVSDDYVDSVDNGNFPPNGLSGTSLATPMVTGVVALMLDANPGLGWRDVQNILAASARHTGSAIGDTVPGTNENGNWFLNDAANWNGGGMHFSDDYGYGIVDAYAAVRMAEVWSLFGSARTTANETWWQNSNGADVTINDDTSESFLTIGSLTDPDIDIEHVDVQIDLTHMNFTNLRIYLVSPEGTEVQLYDGSGGNDTTTDSALTWTFGADAFRGENAFGNWTVRIEDVVAGDSGTLNWFEVKAYGSAASIDDVYHYTDEFLAMKALVGEGGRATLADANGGTDWIDAAAVTGNVALNLNAGAFTTVGGVNWFQIAGGTMIERAVTGDGNDTLTGNGAANKLYGMRGNDTLNGGGADDQMFGGQGSDTYVVDQSGDVADETGGSGTDTVLSSIAFSLSDGAHAKGTIEHLTLTGGGAVSATGNGVSNTLTGNGAANTLDGLGGADTMRGLGGNDTYVVDEGGDVADESGGDGVDLVLAAVSFNLASAPGSIENLTLTGAGAINASGNGLANVLVGNAGANVINGAAGNDTMTGGASADTFVFDTALNKIANVDHVTDFLHGVDRLLLDASVFAKLKVGSFKKKAFFAKDGADKAKDKQDRVIYDTDSGELRFDKDGKGKTKAVLVAVLDGSPDLAHSDILVVA